MVVELDKIDARNGVNSKRVPSCEFRVSNCDFYLLVTRTNRQMHNVKDPAQKGLTMLGHGQPRS